MAGVAQTLAAPRKILSFLSIRLRLTWSMRDLVRSITCSLLPIYVVWDVIVLPEAWDLDVGRFDSLHVIKNCSTFQSLQVLLVGEAGGRSITGHGLMLTDTDVIETFDIPNSLLKEGLLHAIADLVAMVLLTIIVLSEGPVKLNDELNPLADLCLDGMYLMLVSQLRVFTDSSVPATDV